MNSKLTKSQYKTLTRLIKNERLTAEIRHDDKCGNGHNTFSIVCTLEKLHRGVWIEIACGQLHGDFKRFFPELAYLLKWHLCSTDGPMHYLANALYLAGDRDHYGLKAEEKRQMINGKTGEPMWELMAVSDTGEGVKVYELEGLITSPTQPVCNYRLEYVPCYRIGEGKEPDLEAARKTAIWPEAQLKDFTKENLLARLPKLLEEFRKDVEAFGFTW